MMFRARSRTAAVLLCLFSAPIARAADNPSDYSPKVEAASEEGSKAIAKFRVPPGLKVELFAAEPMLANPVAFGVDEKNRFYVVETFRLHQGVTDIRGHMDWLDDDLAARTVADRVAMYRKYLGDKFDTYAKEHDRVRLVEDRNGDGKADQATLFADGFHDAADGLAAGVLARKGKVYLTDLPSLWLLEDRDGDGKADRSDALSSGYGVHVGFLGHDLHGLRMGPDGRVYFSIGDRGLNVKVGDKTLFAPDTGSVLRCEPDGSNLEIFATGLRNPQELVFNEEGDLFTVDNNSDGGDRARLVHLVEGGDSGWRIGWQFIESPNGRGPWNAEKMWHPQNPDQPAFLLPPLVNIADGPSGLTYNPGTGLDDRYRNTFFLCDFRGSSGNSGVRSFQVRPKGASYELGGQEQFLWSMLATDVDFGTDGALYVSDWVEGWNLTGKGRIYKVSDPKTAGDPIRLEVKRLLAQGFERRDLAELTRLLAHPDYRVRQESQFELADRAIAEGKAGGERKAFDALSAAASQGEVAARRHAIWGLGQVERTRAEVGTQLVDLLADPSPEIRFQAARVVNDLGGRYRNSLARSGLASRLSTLLRDPDSRVRFQAALALGKVGDAKNLDDLFTLLRENADRDPYLRHAGVSALSGLGEAPALASTAGDSSPSVRLGALLALRRKGSPEIARFLADSDPRLVLEAARAIHDQRIAGALPALAALATRSDLSNPLWRRVLGANFQLRSADSTEKLAKVASRGDVPEAIRVEALEILGAWPKPSGRDRVTGLWNPLAERPSEEAAASLRPIVASILSEAPDKVRLAAADASGALKVREAGAPLARLAGDVGRGSATRVAALKALDAIGDASLPEATSRAVVDKEPRVRAEGLRLLAKVRPGEALPVLDRVIDSGSLAEKQAALATIAGLSAPEADAILARRLGRLSEGQVPPEIQLDLIEAVGKRSSAEVKAALARFEASRRGDDPLAPYRESLSGGDAERGRKVFREQAAAECLRCHKFAGDGGEVGPDLAGLGKRQGREYILESIVEPNRKIAEGFETIVLALADGTVVTGVLKKEDDKAIHIITAEGKAVDVPKADIEDRKRGASAMPEDTIKKLSKRELRDLVEFLSNAK